MNLDPSLKSLAATIRGIIFDVDGVLTDGRIIYSDDGRELKQFHVQDGASIKQLMSQGIEVGIITGRNSAMVSRRAGELGIQHVAQGVKDKAQALAELCRAGFCQGPLAAVGDDLQDIALFEHTAVELNITVANAHPAVKQRAHFVTQRSGGEGVCVEIAQLVLTAKDQWHF